MKYNLQVNSGQTTMRIMYYKRTRVVGEDWLKANAVVPEGEKA